MTNEDDVLIVVDVQPDFCPGGQLAVPEGDRVVPVINVLLARAAHAVATQDWHPAGHASFASSHAGKRPFETIELGYGTQVLWPDHCVQGTPGAELAAGLETRRIEMVIRKGFRSGIDSYSGFFENDRRTVTGLGGYLRERGMRRLFVAGLALDYCVHFTAMDGLALGFEVVVIEDACRAIDAAGAAAGLADLVARGGRVGRVAEMLQGSAPLG